MPQRTQHSIRPANAAFTVVELLVVMAIIVLLISLAIPFVGKLQDRARETTTRAFIRDLESACERYFQDFRAYPGPLSNDEVYNTAYGTAAMPAFSPTGGFRGGFEMLTPTGYKQAISTNVNGQQRITMAENLVLGLLGGFKIQADASAVTLQYDPERVGKGPMSLNPSSPKAYNAYIEVANLSWNKVSDELTGEFIDDANPDGADDSIIPEFVDSFSDPMPILYLRAKKGGGGTAFTSLNNAVITDDPMLTRGRLGQYDLSQIGAYTKADPPIGVGKKAPKYYEDGTQVFPAPPHHGLREVNTARVGSPQDAPTYTYPYDGFWYFRDPRLSGSTTPASLGQQVARQKDKFILISAGTDRIYGTNDDITNFGSVAP